MRQMTEQYALCWSIENDGQTQAEGMRIIRRCTTLCWVRSSPLDLPPRPPPPVLLNPPWPPHALSRTTASMRCRSGSLLRAASAMAAFNAVHSSSSEWKGCRAAGTTSPAAPALLPASSLPAPP